MDDEPTQEEIDRMSDWLDAEQARRQEMEALPYDGVYGLPPDWVPEPALARFRQFRDDLLDISPHEFVVAQVRAALNGDEPTIPGAVDNAVFWIRSISGLAHVLYAAQLQPNDGLKILANDGREQQRQRAKNKRKKRPRRSRVIAKMKGSRREGHSLKDFLEAAEQGSVDRLCIYPSSTRGIERYAIKFDDGTDGGNPVARSTLSEWWTKAGSMD